MKKTLSVLVLTATFAAGFATKSVLPGEAVAHAEARPRVYELRTYTAVEGKLDALHARFREHILGFFQKTWKACSKTSVCSRRFTKTA